MVQRQVWQRRSPEARVAGVSSGFSKDTSCACVLDRSKQALRAWKPLSRLLLVLDCELHFRDFEEVRSDCHPFSCRSDHITFLWDLCTGTFSGLQRGGRSYWGRRGHVPSEQPDACLAADRGPGESSWTAKPSEQSMGHTVSTIFVLGPSMPGTRRGGCTPWAYGHVPTERPEERGPHSNCGQDIGLLDGREEQMTIFQLPWSSALLRAPAIHFHFELAEYFILHRQTMLPANFALAFSVKESNSFLCGEPSFRGLSLKQVDRLSGAPRKLSGALSNYAGDLRAFLDEMQAAVTRSCWVLILRLGRISQQCFVTLAGIFFIFCCRLLLHACPLKGGRFNCDNILISARGTTGWVPLTTGLILQSFSGLGCSHKSSKRGRKKKCRYGHSGDLWLFLCILSWCLTPVQAAQGSFRHSASCDHTSRRQSAANAAAEPGIGDPALFAIPDATTELDPPPPPPPPSSSSSSSGEEDSSSEPPRDGDEEEEGEHLLMPVLFRVFAFGFPPEYIALGFRGRPELHYAQRQLYADSLLAASSSPGRFIEIRDEPISEASHALWLPHWAVHAAGAFVLFDLESVGQGTCVVFLHSRSATLAHIRDAIAHIWSTGWVVFVPSFSEYPLDEDSVFPVAHGSAVFVQDDWLFPLFHRNSSEAFNYIDYWGADVAGEGVPQDLPWGPAAVQIVCEGNTCLFEFVPGESDGDLLSRIVLAISGELRNPQLVRPSTKPLLPVYKGTSLSEVICLLPQGASTASVVVFLDKRKAGQDWDAIHLQSSDIPNDALIDTLRLEVPRVFGYKLHIEGGQPYPGFLRIVHGQTLDIEIVPETDAFDYVAEAEDDDGPDSSDTDSQDSQGGSWERDYDRSRSPRRRAGGTSSRARLPTGVGQQGHQSASELEPQQVDSMWNCASCVHDANATGRHGDTSATIVPSFIGPSRIHGFDPQPTSKRGALVMGLRLKIFVLSLLGCFRNLDAVILPCSEDATEHTGHAPFQAGQQPCDADMPEGVCYSASRSFPDVAWFAGRAKSGWPVYNEQTSPPACALEISALESSVGADLITLLEQAKGADFYRTCFELVVFLLDDASTGPPRDSKPVRVSLVDTIPCSPFQSLVEELRTFLPSRVPIDLAEWQDWLDCDLQAVYKECHACVAVWDWFSKFGSWYDDPFSPEAVHIYTDGSAGQRVSGALTPASWAFNVWAIGSQRQAYLGHAYGVTTKADSPLFLGEADDEALTGEQLALAWALSWVVEASCAFRATAFILHFDCLTAGNGCFGCFKLPADSQTSKSSCLSRNLAVLRQCAQAVCSVNGRHVPSHSGFAGNELADILAKFAGRHPESDDLVGRPLWPSLVVRHALSEWAWLVLDSQGDLPALGAFESEAGRLFAEAAVRPYTFYAPAKGKEDVSEQKQAQARIQLHLCSLNVLSLREFDDMPQGLSVVGKRTLLKQQFIPSQLHVIALQETRTQGDCIQPDSDFIMLHSSCDPHGCFGCALWLSKCLPVVKTETQTFGFTKECCTVLLSEPRLLIVQVDLPSLSLTIVSAHAPYGGHKTHGAEEFWQKVGNVIAHRPSGAQLVVLTDSNGHVGSVSSSAIGTAGPECENSAGTAFHAFLVKFGLCLPSTFHDLHVGGHLTWKVGSATGHRLDYVAVPEDWLSGRLESSVWYDFDHVHDVDDHQPVLLACDLLRRTDSRRSPVRIKAPKPHPDTDPGQLQCFQYAIASLPRVGWTVDVDQHYAAFVQSTVWCWSEFVAHTPRKRCKPFVSEATLTAIEHRKRVRQYLTAEEASLAHVRKLAGIFAFWLQWRHAQPMEVQVMHLSNLLRRGRLSIASAIGFLGRLRVFLRKAIKEDRATYLHRLAVDVAESPLQQSKQLFAAVYRAFPVVKSKRKSGFCPLPAVFLEDGTRAQSTSERLQRWTEHFAQQEGGRIVPEADYDLEVLQQAPNPADVPSFDVRCVPSLLDIEQDILKLRRGKAAGPDLITADLLKLDVPSSSRRLLPIFAKAALSCREPIVFKGGCLITLAKKAHASLNCSDFRSIILSSVPGKLLHRSLRRCLLQPLSEVTLPLQAGATPGTSPELLTIYLTSFQRWANAAQGRWAVTFFDVKQAYYRTLRQLVVDCDSDEGLCRVLHGLGLSGSALCELRDLLQRAATASPLAGMQHLQALLRDLLTATWFKFEASLLISVTHKGTRPGDPAADVLFAFTLSALFHAINGCLEAHGLIDDLPATKQAPLVQGLDAPASLQFVSWADDFARPFLGNSAKELLGKVQRATKCCTERASACGIELTFGKDKTAAVFDGNTVRTLQAEGCDLVSDGVHFADDVTGKCCVLPVVHAYKHLGGIFSTNAKPDLEIFFRRAAALGPLRPVRAKLFANSSVPLAIRRTLLYSLGLARFVHGAGALHLNQKGHQRSWHATYVGIWAHLVPSHPSGKPHSFQVLFVSKAPPPHLFLALQRAALLSRLISRQLLPVLHMLQLEWEAASHESWLTQVVNDIKAVAEWIPAARRLSQSNAPIQELCAQIGACPAWWSLLIRQACKCYAADIIKWRQQPRIIAVPDGGAFQCHICGDSFAQRSFLAVHLARRHRLFAPARHFAPSRQCISCLRTFSTVMLAQAHLRRTPTCLRRAAGLMQPLSLEDVHIAEKEDKLASRAVRNGGWQRQSTVVRAKQGAGPLQITSDDIESDPESFAILLAARTYRPDKRITDWIEGYLEGSTRSGHRLDSSCWWHGKPSLLNST